MTNLEAPLDFGSRSDLRGRLTQLEAILTPVADVMARFEMFDERGQPFPLERLPGRLALQGIETEQLICYRVREIGSLRWSIVRATPVFDDHGAILFAVNAFQDVTARKLAEDRLRLLADASGLLGSLDYYATLERIPALVVPGLADACSIWFAEGDELRRVASYANDPEKQAAWEAVPRAYSLTRDADTLMVRMFAKAEPVAMHDIAQDTLRTAGRNAEEMHALDRLASRSALVVPLVARGRTFGLLSLISFERGRFRDEDLALAKELTDRVSLALDRALLYRESQDARMDLEFLAEAGQMIGASLDYEETLATLSRLVVPGLATWSGFYLVDEHQNVRRMFGAHVDEKRRALVEETAAKYPFDLTNPDQPIALALFEGRSSIFPAVTDEALRAASNDDEHYEAMRALGFETAMVVPLETSGRVIGAMTLVRTGDEPPYAERDLRLAEELGRRAAVAIENARNYERAQGRAHAAQALEFVGDGVFLVDRDAVVRLWNPAAESITGLANADVVGRPAEEAIPGWSELAPRIPISERPEALPLVISGRELWLSIAGVDFGEGVVYAFRDVTDERTVDRMKTDFISTVSHELRTPLAAIYGAAMTVRRGELPADRREELIALIGTEAERLARTINDVLWASRLESGTLAITIESCDPVELLEGVTAAARLHLPSNLAIELDAPEGLPRVAADPDKVRQVLENLVENAVKYSPDGGVIRVSAEPAGHVVRFAVADEGLGIPPAERERIFDKFYRLDPNLTRGVGGTGLGLYICRALVQRMDGRIMLARTGTGTGSTFVVELPVAS